MAKLEIPKIKIVPINDAKQITELTEQLNALLDSYNTIYGIFLKTMYVKDSTKERLESVLANIEKAIDALCFRITHAVYTLNTESNTTQHF